MMYTRFLCGTLLMLAAIAASAQRGAVRGRVVDAKTLEPLPYANVYFNYTSIGTSTDANGEFTLTVQPGTHELVISFVGYKSYQGKVTIFDNYTSELSIRMVATTLSEVTVRSTRDKQWKVQLEKFKRTFFGKSEYTEQCTILNTWVLDFNEDSEGVFTAWANSPLSIENMALGYKLFYQLNRFSVGPAQFTISGTVRFQEMQSTDTAVTRIWHRNRENAYRGSTRHLLKAILDRRTREEGFEIFEDISQQVEITRSSAFLSNINKNIKEFNPEQTVSTRTASGEYKLMLPSRMEVHYQNRTAPATIYHSVAHPISWIEVKNTAPIVTQDGILTNQGSVVVSGALSDSRIANLLPYDYRPQPYTPRPTSDTQGSTWAALVEKPYVHTDKSYYYPGETIWMKAYINYYAPAMKDSLSRVIYIDLVNRSQQIIATKVFAIQNGTAAASFTLPNILPKGDYQLRAFTRWMHNFGGTYTFIKPIKILDDLECVRSTGVIPKLAVSSELAIQSSKDVYATREEIKVTLELKNFYDFQEVANLSISVTDIDQVVPALNETTILSNFPIDERQLPRELQPDKNYFIQTGIDLSGQFLTAKKKPAQGKLTLVQEETNDVFVTTTDKTGSFRLHGLLIYDSIPLAVQATTVKRKRPGFIKLDSMHRSPVYVPTELLQLAVEKSDNNMRAHRHDEAEQLPARILDEVTIEGTKINEIKTSVEAPHLADFQVSGEWLLETNSNDVLQSIRVKVPGMRVAIFMENGVVRKYLSFGISSFGPAASNEPLLLIDGMVINSDGDMTVAERIASLNPYEIERIDVVRFGGAAAYGARGGNGVIAIFTRKTPPGIKTVGYDRNKLQPLRVAGFSPVRKFIPTDYSTAHNPAKKDYRSVIYWNPQVALDGKTSTTLHFYAADLPTTYRIVVEGVAASGKPVRAEKLITVVKAP